MLTLSRSIRCALATGRHASLLHGSTRLSLLATDLAPSSAVAWGSLVSSSRCFSQLSGLETDSTVETPAKAKFHRPRKAKASAKEAAKQSELLAKLQANEGNVDTALEVLAAIRAADGSGLSNELATTLLTTFVNQNKVDKALQVLSLSYNQRLWLRAPPFETLITRCYKTKDFDTALQVFDTVQRVKVSPGNLVCTTAMLAAHRAGRSELVPKILEKMLKDAKPYASRAFQVALSAAVKSRQHQLVLQLIECSKTLDVALTSEHYHFVLRSYAAVGDMEAVLGTRDTLQENGFELTDDGIHWLVHCACRTDQWDLVQGLLTPPVPSADSGEGVATMVIAFNAAIAAYGNKERWTKVVDVYDLMPENLRPELKGWHLGAVVMAHAKAENKETKLRALEIFNEHKDKAGELAYAGAITALLETEQFDEALTFAEDMKEKEIAWGKNVYQAVALALIRRGTGEEAVQLLETSVRSMGNGPEGYLNIIQFYTDRHPCPDTEQA
ncbi:Pentatricopeptide repeat-containing protein [Phytophthora cinnamomi]|uniref:Pentatricopeptide repeat-containing protein n=1 Tax=Phytophthora cinnamomi TaxID=4785 RepID=UPI00355A0B01|nr:Pentatricopeptide repeat-containing protein [Phytophthora cinnamomi]